MKRTAWLDSLLLACFVSVLIWPLFHLTYFDNWGSIESTFIADARMLANHLPHPGWQPLWYCGTRFDYIYPPALRYATALIALAGRIPTARAYNLYTGAMYVLGICAVYALTWVGSRSRKAALLAAFATALLSPSFVFLPAIRHDSFHYVPQRLHVLARYGEGPHISSLSILPAALAAAFLAIRSRRPALIALAAVLCALDVSNNFYGATALAIFFPILVWSVWLGERTWRVWTRSLAIVALAYGLCAFWLTPSYIRITLLNLKWVAQPGNRWSLWVALLAVAVFCAGSLRFGRRREDVWTVFVIGLVFFLSIDVLGWFYFRFHVTGDSQRLIPELDLALILGFVEGMRVAWRYPWLRSAAILLIAQCFLPSLQYLRHAWYPFPPAAPLRDSFEYQIAQWTHTHLPTERIFTSGAVRFWYDAWDDNAESDGGSSQGMLNQVIPYANWQISAGDQAGPGVLWLKALGDGAVIASDKNSLDVYHDFWHAEKFAGALPALFDDHHGTVIYGIPRVHPGIGRIVSQRALTDVGAMRSTIDFETLARYVDVVERPQQPLVSVAWPDYDHAEVHAEVAAGESILLQETYDPAWRAEQNGKPVPIRVEPLMNFMLIDAPPGQAAIHMRFVTPWENHAGQVLFALSLLILGALIFDGRLPQRLTIGRTPAP